MKASGVLQVVVATPGRLWELVRLGEPHLADLSRVGFLVLDEADRMAQQGHFQVPVLALSFCICWGMLGGPHRAGPEFLPMLCWMRLIAWRSRAASRRKMMHLPLM